MTSAAPGAVEEIPTLSGWGLVLTVLALLAAAALLSQRRSMKRSV
ncbi:MAG TPA: hypothetical protein VJ891_01325 [Casimicrobiaceae bacterium]|nr:hypothetical protein [Casimicrobiaceae bacterium]